MKITLLNGHVLDMLNKIPDESIDCIVSSCPYYGLMDYSGVATYASEDYDDLLVIANTDLQKHRDRVSESQKDRYYLTEPSFNEKDKKWNISLKYDTSGVWGGNPECEHEWISHQIHKDNLRFRDPNHTASVGNNKNAEIFADPTVLSGNCSKCGAWKGQLGLESLYQEYIGHLMLVMRELKRVLKKTGALFWNMGDSYAGDMGSRAGWQDSKYSESREEGINNGEAVFLKADYGNIQTKSLMMIPERFAMAMIDDGWVLRNKIVWFKRNGMPSSVKDRLSNKWEYVFFFTKAQKYYFDLDSIRKPLEESSIKRISQKNIPNQFKSGKSVEFAKTDPVNNIPKILNNMHQKYQQNGTYQGSPSGYFNDDGSLRVNQNGTNPGDVISQPAVRHKSWASNPGHKFPHERKYDPDADGGDFFDIPTRAHSFAHFAVFPETLVEPFIKAGCPSDGIVLDPFAGSGTVGVVAMKQEKNAILIEISPEYCNIIKKRLNWGVGLDVEYSLLKEATK